MKPVYFSICPPIVANPDQWTIVELRIEELKKAFMTMCYLDRSIYLVILVSR